MPRPCTGGCWTWAGSIIAPFLDHFESRGQRVVAQTEKFEQVTLFLALVPLFKKQIPRAELPMVAQELLEKVYLPGRTLVRQGDTGKDFFLIYSGEASVLVVDADGVEHETGRLGAGDWLGGHALTSERSNVATVVARGPQPLVTLTMSKAAFQRSGLRDKLVLPKRPAMRAATSQVALALGCSSSHLSCPKCPDGDFILAALRANANLRAFCDSIGDSADNTEEVLETLSYSAEMREVPAGTVVAESGSLGQELFVIQEGSFEIIRDAGNVSRNQSRSQNQSAEETVASFSMAERLRRKQNFMLQLLKPVTPPANGKHFNSFHFSSSSLRKVRDVQGWLERVPSVPHRKRDDAHKWTAWSDKSYSIATLRSGDSFGELSLLYNTRREATFRALEDAVVYSINRRAFKQLTGRCNGRRRLEEYCALLDEVDLLTSLLRSERRELACNASQVVSFSPGQRVLTQGKVRQQVQWYVVHSGSAVLWQDQTGPGDQVQIGRAGHFGERSLLSDDTCCCSESNVDAGPDGLTCLLFDGEIIGELFRGLAVHEESVLRTVNCAIGEHCRAKQLQHRRARTVDLESLKEICVLGKGSFGCVYLTRDAVEQKLYALKRLSKGHVQREGCVQQLCWERDILSMLDNPFVMRLHGTLKDKQFVYLIQEAMLGGDLRELVSKHWHVFSEDSPRGSSTAFYAACIIAGLEHLHERKIVHRDIKLENIMLDTTGYAKICDMGLARFVCGKTNSLAGTMDYMAPEVIDPPHFHDCAADWWSLGVLVFELLCGQTPFDDEGLDEEEERLLAIRRSQELPLDFRFTCPVLARQLVKKLLQKLPSRLGADGGAAAIRQHNFFTKMKFNFKALHSQTLPSPWSQPWEEPENAASGALHGPLGADYDSITVPYTDDGSEWAEDF